MQFLYNWNQIQVIFQVNIFSEILNKFYNEVAYFWSEPPGKPHYSFI